MHVAVCAVLGGTLGLVGASWLVTLARDRGHVWWLSRPAVGVAGAVAGAGAAAVTGPRPALAGTLVLAVAACGACLVDAAAHRIPDAIVLRAYPVALLAYGGAALIGGDGGSLLRALAGGVACWGLYALLAWIYPPGIGYGDVKLAGLLGIGLGWFGWPHLVVGLLAAFLLGGLGALALLLAGRARRSTAIPFGPWMLAGAAVGAAWGPAIAAGLLAV